MTLIPWLLLWFVLFAIAWAACRYHPRYSYYAMEYSPTVDFTGCLLVSSILTAVLYTVFAV